MGKLKPPCKKDCPKRTTTCHSTCIKWAVWEAVRRREYKQRSIKNEVEGYFHQRQREIDHDYNRKKRR